MAKWRRADWSTPIRYPGYHNRRVNPGSDGMGAGHMSTIGFSAIVSRRSFCQRLLAAGAGAHQLGLQTQIAAGESTLPQVRLERAEFVVIEGARGLKWILMRLRSHEGVVGIGECWPWFQRGVIDCVKEVTAAATNSDALNIKEFIRHLATRRHDLAWLTAVSGMEIALWDIAGQLLEKPIHALLGGHLRDRIPLYANHGIFLPNSTSLKSRIERAIAAKEAGFTALKWDPTTPYGPRGAKQIDRIVHEIAAFRQAVGPDFVLAIDAHNNLSLAGAVELAKQIDQFRLLFFEAPVIWPNDRAGRNRPKALRQVAGATAVPIAIGEWLHDEREAAELIRETSIGIIQPEVSQIGGIQAMHNVATVAARHGVRVAPHHWTSPVLALAASHVSVAIPNLLRQEFAGAVSNYSWEHDLLEPPLMVDQGELVVSQRPGLGAKLNEQLVRSKRIE